MKIVLAFLLLHISAVSYCQSRSILDYSDTLNNKRRNAVYFTESVGTVSSLALLNEMWYKNYSTGKFHFFNDSKEWLQVDKMGHTMTSYYVGIAGIEALKWSGLNNKKASFIGGSLGLVYLTGVEVLDGFSDKWGFSNTDLLANTSGSIIAIGQNLLWEEQRIKLKFSAHKTIYASYRPNLLGSNFFERALKDYNGQTYWLSINVNSFMKKDSKIPKWINIALGYGAEEMISGNTDSDWCINNPICDELDRYRQFYISLDADLSKINYKRKFFKLLFGTFGFIKFPSPTIEFSKLKVKGHLFYF